MLEWRLEAYRRWLTMTEPTWARVNYPKIDYQDLYYYSAPKPKKQIGSLDEIDPEILKTYEKLGIPLREVEVLEGVVPARKASARSRSMPCSNSVSVATTFKEELKKAGVIFMPISEAIREHPELVKKYLGTVVPTSDNYLRDAEFGGVLRRLVRLRAAGRALPDGAVDLFPHQRAQHRPVRAHADHRRQGRLRQLSRRLHRAAARREPAARRRGRTGHARRRRDQIFDGAELVSRQFRRQGRHLQFRHQARRLPRQELEDLLDPGRDRLGDHLEISELHPARRQFARRVLFDRDLERPPAGRFRHQDDPSRQEHDEPHHLQGHRRRRIAEHLSRPRHRASQGDRRAQLHRLRLASDRRQMRRAHRALYRGQEFLGAVRARGDHLEDFRGRAVLLRAARPVARKRPSASSSTASSRTCCSNCRWNSRSRRRS